MNKKEQILERLEELKKEEKKLQLLQLNSFIDSKQRTNEQFYKVRSLRREIANLMTEYKAENEGVNDIKATLIEDDPSTVFFRQTFGKKLMLDKEDIRPAVREKMIDQYMALSDLDCNKAKEEYDLLETDKEVVEKFANIIKKSKKERVYLDIETTELSPSFGDIIEIGIVVVDSDDNVIETYDKRFDLAHPDKTLKYKAGVGATDVHKIAPEDVEGLKDFHDKEIQEEIGAIVNKPNRVLVAHNDEFEYKWLETHLDGFYEAYNRYSDESIDRDYDTINKRLDTRVISMAFFHDTENSKLESFVEGNGLEYIDAHSAYPDTFMMYEAFKIFADRFAILKDRPENLKKQEEVL